MSSLKGQPPRKIFVTVNLAFNIFLSILIVTLNKTVYTKFHFPNMALTCLHFVFTSVGMILCSVFGVFNVKRLPIMEMIPISFTFCGFVVFTNLSLQNNTVGTYQIIKCMTTPVIMVIQTYFYNRKFSVPIRLTLIPITLGVILNSMFDIKFNAVGILYASCGVLVTSLYQVWVAEKQKQFQINSMQLLFYQAPLSAVAVGGVVPFFEPLTGPGGVFGSWSFLALGTICLTGLVAFFINLSIFWIIGNTSPITYNMVGHTKFTLTLIMGFILFKDPISLSQFFGIVVTFCGIFLYTHIKLKEQNKATLENISETQKGHLQSVESTSHSAFNNNNKEVEIKDK